MKRFNIALVAVAICMIAATSVSAQSGFGLRGVGVKAGFVDPEDIGSTFGFGLVVDLGVVKSNFAVESYMNYWSYEENLFIATASMRDIAIGGRGKYMFDVSSPTVRPYAGLGLGIHMLKAEIATTPISFGGTVFAPGTSESDTETRLGLDIGGGMLIDSGNKFAFTTEAWYSLVSDVGHLSVTAGLVYMIGR